MNKDYSFSVFNEYASLGITTAISNIIEDDFPVILCIGSDLVLGDSLGPIVGNIISKKIKNAYVYGNLSYPITAKEIPYVKDNIKKFHPNSKIIAVDAAVGEYENIGIIKVNDKPVKPGQGVNKKLDSVGDMGIIGIVAEKSVNNKALYNYTRLSLVDKMANVIAKGIEDYFVINNKNEENIIGAKEKRTNVC